MMSALVSTIIATCISGSSYTGSTQVTLDRSDDQFSYHMSAETIKGPDGDGQEAKAISTTDLTCDFNDCF
jgi:hypothetical protein